MGEMGWGLEVAGNSSVVAAAVAVHPQKVVFLGQKIVCFLTHMRATDARRLEIDRTDAAVLKNQ